MVLNTKIMGISALIPIFGTFSQLHFAATMPVSLFWKELVAAHRKAIEEAAQELRRSALFGDAWA